MRGILNYNENKVAEGAANLILASGFAGDIEKMSLENKVQRFKHLTELKPSVKTNALHITLNFEATEKIDNSKMQQIAIRYMELIGFGEQPFLAYRHSDVAHQHVHIATTSIQRNGQSINLHNIGREMSEPARKQIEKDFNLVVAQRKKYKPQPSIKAVNPEVINYGHIPTKRAINNVVNAVVETYKFTSVAEFNTVLKQFNVFADRGSEDTDMFQKKGLQYAILDKHGIKVGVPIKASSFYSKPTLRNLEKDFERNVEERKPYRSDLINRIDIVFNKFQSATEATLRYELDKLGINLMLRRSDNGFIYGATFVDNINKAVFNGSSLGKPYSAKSIEALLASEDRVKVYLKPFERTNTFGQENRPSSITFLAPINKTNYLEELLGKTAGDFTPTIGNSKKKKKRGLTR